MPNKPRNKWKPQRTIITRLSKLRSDLLNKSSEVPIRANQLQSNMSATNSSSVNNNQIKDIVKGYGLDNKMHFFSDRGDFRTWQTRFKLHLRKLKLDHILDAEQPDPEKNLEVYMEIVEHIDDKSLKLFQDLAEDNGKLAWKILSETYLGNNEDRIFKVLIDFSNLLHKRGETIIDYLCRIDEIKKILETNKIILPDNLYIIMTMKGLGEDYDILCDVIQTQKIKPTYEEFKSQLKAKEIRINDAKLTSAAKIMNVEESVNNVKLERKCYKCNKYGHYVNECDYSKYCERCRKNGHFIDDCKSTRYCDHCKNYNHLTDDCWYKPKDSTNTVCMHDRQAGVNYDMGGGSITGVNKPGGNLEHVRVAPAEYYDLSRTKETCPEAHRGIVGAVSTGAHSQRNKDPWEAAAFKPPTIWHVRHRGEEAMKYLVDTGATHHIITDVSKFITLDSSQDTLQQKLILANGSSESGRIKGIGVANITVHDAVGNPQRIILTDALYVPSFSQNILSVMSLVNSGMVLQMKKDEVILRDERGTSYMAQCDSGLAYLKAVD